MAFQTEDREELILRILNGRASCEDIREFTEWLAIPENETYFLQLKKLWNLTSGPKASPEQVEAELDRFRKFMRGRKERNTSSYTLTLRRAIKWAAILLLPLTLGVYLFLKTEKSVSPFDMQDIAAIYPGESKAVLTTADGRQVALGFGEQGRVEVGQKSFIRDNGSSVIYADSLLSSEKIQYNYLNVPRGGEYKVVLSDGTEVYMNSASELKYPIVFGKDERVVYLSGEAYFKVKKDVGRPFYVYANSVKIRVYGTSFNVNTHQAESIRTVLIEGSVGIQGKGPEYLMRPSQLAEYGKDGVMKQIREVDVRPYIAWREGLFLFEDQGLEEIMNTLSLWYDVDVFYASEEVKSYHFTGYMQRYEQIDRILSAISKMVGVHFKINGKTIVVSK